MILIELVKEVYAAVSASSFGTDIRNLKPNSRTQDIKLGCWLAGRGTKQTDGTVDSSGICLSRWGVATRGAAWSTRFIYKSAHVIAVAVNDHEVWHVLLGEKLAADTLATKDELITGIVDLRTASVNASSSQMGKTYALALGVGGVRHGRQRDVGHELRDFFAGSTLFVTPGVDKLPAIAGKWVVSDRLVDQGKQLPTVGLGRRAIGRENIADDDEINHGAARCGILALEVEEPGLFEGFRSMNGSEGIPSLDELTDVYHRRRCSIRRAACLGI
jgi:hypothetical protein